MSKHLFCALFPKNHFILLSSYSVFFPDIAEMYTIVLLAWMYLSPVIVLEETLAGIMNSLVLKINPLHYLIKLFRLVLFKVRIKSVHF